MHSRMIHLNERRMLPRLIKGFPESAVVNDVSVADAALTVIVNRQTDGYVYVPVP